MKFNLLKQNLAFVLLFTIATAGISIPFITQADAMVKHQTIEQKDITLAEQIVATTTGSVKSLFTEKKTEKMAKVNGYLSNVQPCGPLSTMVAQSVQQDWTQLLSALQKVTSLMSAKKHLEPAFHTLGDRLYILANNIETMGCPTVNNLLTQLRSAPGEIKNLSNKLSMMTKIKIAKKIKSTNWA